MENTVSILVLLQVIYAILIVSIGIVTVIWSMKTGQFKNQKHVSRLPLEIDEPAEESSALK